MQLSLVMHVCNVWLALVLHTRIPGLLGVCWVLDLGDAHKYS